MGAFIVWKHTRDDWKFIDDFGTAEQAMRAAAELASSVNAVIEVTQTHEPAAGQFGQTTTTLAVWVDGRKYVPEAQPESAQS